MEKQSRYLPGRLDIIHKADERHQSQGKHKQRIFKTTPVTKLYREALDALAAGKSAEEAFDHAAFEEVERLSPREWGIGTYRFRQSRNSI